MAGGKKGDNKSVKTGTLLPWVIERNNNDGTFPEIIISGILPEVWPNKKITPIDLVVVLDPIK